MLCLFFFCHEDLRKASLANSKVLRCAPYFVWPSEILLPATYQPPLVKHYMSVLKVLQTSISLKQPKKDIPERKTPFLSILKRFSYAKQLFFIPCALNP